MREVNVQAVIDRQRLQSPHFVLLALCTFVMFIDAFDIFMVGQIAPAIAKGMGEPPARLTIVFLVQQIGLAVGAFTISPLSDRWGRKPLLIGCTLAFGALTLVSLAATSLLMLAILRGFAGLFLAAVIPNASALLTEFAPPRHRASFVTFSFVGYVAGSGAAALVTLFLLGQYGWRSCFVIGGVMPFLFALLFWRFGEESVQFRARRDAGDASIGRTLARFEPGLADGDTRFVVPAAGPRAKGGIGDVFGGGRAGMTLLLWFSYFVGLGTISLLASWAATFFNVLAGVPLTTYAAASLFFLSGSLVGTLGTGLIMDRLGPSRALVGLSIGAAIALALLGSAPFGFALVAVRVRDAGGVHDRGAGRAECSVRAGLSGRDAIDRHRLGVRHGPRRRDPGPLAGRRGGRLAPADRPGLSGHRDAPAAGGGGLAVPGAPAANEQRMTARRRIDVSELIEQQRWGPFGARLLVLSCLVTFVDGFDMQGIAYLAPYIAKDFGLSTREIGTLFTAGIAGAMLGGPLCGYLGDRLGRRPTIVAATLLSGLLTAALVLAHDFHTFLVLRFLGGMAIGGVLPVAWALNIDFAPARSRSTVIVLVMIGYFLGSTVSGPLTVALAPTHGWRGAVPDRRQRDDALGGRAADLAARIRAPSRPHRAQPASPGGDAGGTRPQAELSVDDEYYIADEARDDARPFRMAQLFEGDLAVVTPLLWLAYIASSLAIYFGATWGPILFETIGFTRTAAAYIATTTSVGGAVLGLILGRLIDRLGPKSMTVMPFVAAPLLVLLGVTVLAPIATAAVAIAANALMGGTHSGMHSIAGRFYPSDRRANGGGWATSVAKIGSVAAPWLGGILLSSGMPVRRSFLFLAACPIVLGISILIVAATLRRRPVPA